MGKRSMLELRELALRLRHERIIATFHNLKPGEAFVLVNDSDPKPFYDQFQAQHAGHFSWDYLEEGPEVRRVRIGQLGQ